MIPFELIDDDLSIKKRPHLRCFTFRKVEGRKFFCVAHEVEFEANHEDLNRCRVGYKSQRFQKITVR